MKGLTVVIPSRGRAGNMPVTMSLFPDAYVCVDKSEVADYKVHVPEKQIIAHPKLTPGANPKRNWIIKNVKAPILVMIDDDVTCVQSNLTRRKYTEPDDVMTIIENAARCADDLDVGAFCWSRTTNTTIVRPEERPICPVGVATTAFGIRGDARHRKWDEGLPGRGDPDWTLQSLLEDRMVYQDVRFYFVNGLTFSGAGGNAGIVTAEAFTESTRRLKEKWGKHVKLAPVGFQKNRDVAPMRINVTRTNKAAQR